MFSIEIANAEKKKKQWWCLKWCYKKIKSPSEQNLFIRYILNPFVGENVCKRKERKSKFHLLKNVKIYS